MWTPTADLSDDDLEGTLRHCLADLRSYGGHDHVAGRVRTLQCFEDSLLIKGLIEEDGSGCVLVVDGGGGRSRAIFGESSAQTAIEHGWTGVIINGVVRDVDSLVSLPLHIKALGTMPRRAGRAGTGAVDVPVQFGGVDFFTGDGLWSDADGLVVGPLQRRRDAAMASGERPATR